MLALPEDDAGNVAAHVREPESGSVERIGADQLHTRGSEALLRTTTHIRIRHKTLKQSESEEQEYMWQRLFSSNSYLITADSTQRKGLTCNWP